MHDTIELIIFINNHHYDIYINAHNFVSICKYIIRCYSFFFIIIKNSISVAKTIKPILFFYNILLPKRSNVYGLFPIGASVSAGTSMWTIRNYLTVSYNLCWQINVLWNIKRIVSNRSHPPFISYTKVKWLKNDRKFI